eukprot:922459-Amphidinium_carterae.1
MRVNQPFQNFRVRDGREEAATTVAVHTLLPLLQPKKSAPNDSHKKLRSHGTVCLHAGRKQHTLTELLFRFKRELYAPQQGYEPFQIHYANRLVCIKTPHGYQTPPNHQKIQMGQKKLKNGSSVSSGGKVLEPQKTTTPSKTNKTAMLTLEICPSRLQSQQCGSPV